MRRMLERVEIPGEIGAEIRTRRVVAAAFAEREPKPPRPHGRRRAFAAATVAAAAAVAVGVSPAGSEFVQSVRREIGLRHAAPALTSLPTGGQLLVISKTGPWIVQADGSKRFLGRYTEASWSPHGLFVAVTRRHELLAVDPKGNVRWSLARGGSIAVPRWAPDGYRIAYRNGSSLRIVAGDGTGDRRLAAELAPVAPAWRPTTSHEHVLAFVRSHDRLVLEDTDTGRVIARRLVPPATQLAWSTDGLRLAVLSHRAVAVFDREGDRLASLRFPREARHASFVPGGHQLTVVLRGLRSDALTYDLDHPHAPPREIFSGTGTFGGLAWAPDGRWLLLAWPTAGQWLFVGPSGHVRADAGIAAELGPAPAPAENGWCCSGG
jgi:dipeptidyl aminopeptidase/acylaminoacyl peptidase